MGLLLRPLLRCTPPSTCSVLSLGQQSLQNHLMTMVLLDKWKDPWRLANVLQPEPWKTQPTTFLHEKNENPLHVFAADLPDNAEALLTCTRALKEVFLFLNDDGDGDGDGDGDASSLSVPTVH